MHSVYSWESMLIKIPTFEESDLLFVALVWRNYVFVPCVSAGYWVGASSDSQGGSFIRTGMCVWHVHAMILSAE